MCGASGAYFPPQTTELRETLTGPDEPTVDWRDVADAGDGTPNAGFIEVTVSKDKMVRPPSQLHNRCPYSPTAWYSGWGT